MDQNIMNAINIYQESVNKNMEEIAKLERQIKAIKENNKNLLNNINDLMKQPK